MKVKGRPITPAEAASTKQAAIPPKVFDVFNELILEGLDSGESTVYQKEVVKRLVKKGLSSTEIFDNGWLNVEPIYRKAGWIVEYDKPAYNEDYEPTFKFRKR